MTCVSRVLHGAVGWAVLVVLLCCVRVSAQGATSGIKVQKAADALMSTYDAQSGLFRGTGWWNSANGVTALVDASRTLQSHAYDRVWPTTFVQAQHKFPGFRNEFYDDEGWWALAWLDAYRLRGERRYLTMASSIFEDMSGGWSDTCGGGIWWKKNEHYKNAIANELFFSVAVQLAEASEGAQRERYLRWAQREQRWFVGSGMINKDSMVNDGLDAGCKNNGQTTWSYNQGVLVGALAGMHRLTGDKGVLELANRVAAATMTRMADSGGVLHDACEPKCGDDGVQFKGVLVRNLAALYVESPNEPLRGFLERNAEAVWTRARTGENRFSVVWSGPPTDDGTGALISALDALVAGLRVSH